MRSARCWSAPSPPWPVAARAGGGRSSSSAIPVLVLAVFPPPHPREARGPVRDDRRARRGHRPRAVPMSMESVSSPSSRSGRWHGRDGVRGPGLRAVHRAGAGEPLRRGALRSTRSNGACSAPSAASSPWSPSRSRRHDRFREDPEKALRLVGLLILPVALLVPIQYSMPNAMPSRSSGSSPAASS